MSIKPELMVAFSILLLLSELSFLASQNAPAPSPDCFLIISDKLLPCLEYVTPDSNLTTPPNDCCNGLATIVKEAPICLCQFVTSNDDTFEGLPINVTRTRSLPATCNVSTPPTSECKNHGARPTPAPIPRPPSPYGMSSTPASIALSSTDVPTVPGAPKAPQGPNGGVTSVESSVGILLTGLLLAVTAI